MRVAVVTESFLPAANGVTTSVLRVLDYLRLHGHEALVVCPGPAPGSYAGFEVVHIPAVTWRGFPVGLPSPRLRLLLSDWQPDVLHAASPFVLGAHGLAVARRQGVPSVAVFQTDVAGFARRQQLGAAAGPVWRWLRRTHAMADLTLAPSTTTLAQLRARSFPRTALWARGVDTTGYHPRHRTSQAGRAARARLAADGEVLVGYVGRLAPEKRVERLAVLAGLPGVRLVVVGEGPSARRLERLLGPHGATFLGRLDGEALAGAYAALDVFVHTGTDETFGQSVQEAMASGVPVVAPACGGPLDTVHDGRTGYLYAPEDDAALRDAVRTLAADPALRASMGEAGRRCALSRSWDGAGAQLVRHYRDVVARAADREPSRVQGP